MTNTLNNSMTFLVSETIFHCDEVIFSSDTGSYASLDLLNRIHFLALFPIFPYSWTKRRPVLIKNSISHCLSTGIKVSSCLFHLRPTSRFWENDPSISPISKRDFFSEYPSASF